jgi:exopolyphosphatase/guanosine-5'-triphosphate,3'-diphosphate pyrophosphatase
MRIAVIDLGTNTFNLLIAELNAEKQLEFLFRDRRPVFLGRNGIGQNIIASDAMLRAWEVLREYRRVSQAYRVEKILAYGTSAIRSAHNASEFTAEAEKILGAQIDVIEGSEEAGLIYMGVRQSIEPTRETFLIVDIGGGSNELIIGNSESIFWKKSYPIGMARIKAQFEISDPITPSGIDSLNQHFESVLSDFLQQVLPKYSVNTIIGAEGAFESFLHMASPMGCMPQPAVSATNVHSHYLPYECFRRVRDALIPTTLDQRMKIEGLEPFRAELIVPAVIFVDFLLNRLQLPRLIISEYSLKEGAAWKYFFGANHPVM